MYTQDNNALSQKHLFASGKLIVSGDTLGTLYGSLRAKRLLCGDNEPTVSAEVRVFDRIIW